MISEELGWKVLCGSERTSGSKRYIVRVDSVLCGYQRGKSTGEEEAGEVMHG